jgi:hypothetical protein
LAPQALDIGKIAELVFSGGTALAALVLVCFLGFLIASFFNREANQRKVVQGAYQRRAVVGMMGFAESLRQ